ncbi:MAG: hypothetical protein IKB68_04805 [Rikenellaceae bacterium]|nr:hypothetical protein [Rikenellaceae bacterium]
MQKIFIGYIFLFYLFKLSHYLRLGGVAQLRLREPQIMTKFIEFRFFTSILHTFGGWGGRRRRAREGACRHFAFGLSFSSSF